MRKVFIVDDEPVMVNLLTKLIEMEGFDVQSDVIGEDIHDKIVQVEPDCIILDLHLRIGDGREINGFEILDKIRLDEKTNKSKVIMSSGLDYRDKSEARGADGFLLKPFPPDELINMMKELLE